MKFFLKLFSIIFIFISIILFLDSFKLIEPATACKNKDNENLGKEIEDKVNGMTEKGTEEASRKKAGTIDRLGQSSTT